MESKLPASFERLGEIIFFEGFRCHCIELTQAVDLINQLISHDSRLLLNKEFIDFRFPYRVYRTRSITPLHKRQSPTATIVDN